MFTYVYSGIALFSIFHISYTHVGFRVFSFSFCIGTLMIRSPDKGLLAYGSVRIIC